MRSRLLCLVGLAAVAAACSSSKSPSSTPPTTALPTTTTLPPVSAQGFTSVLPPDWTNKSQDSTAISQVAPTSGTNGTDILLLQPNATSNGLVGHISVNIAPQPVADADLPAYLQSAGSHGATQLSTPEAKSIDGASGFEMTYTVTQADGSTTRNDDIVVNHNGQTYDVIYDVPTAQFDSLHAALDVLVANWKWS
jgi:hypothetical protein